MRDTRVLEFAAFRLDLGAERLWRGAETVQLTAKAFGVLRHLVSHTGRLVTRDELIEAVWALPYVSEAALTVCIGEIRRALGDTTRAPQYVETVRGRGYRFVAPVMVAPVAPAPPGAEPPPVGVADAPVLLVEREAELAQLWQWWGQARQGTRQVVLVTGEAGIGKTTLVDAWVAQVVATESVWVGRGQCIEQYGAGEAYLPLLEALGRLGRGPEGARLVAVLHQHAPSWLVHLPALVPPEAFEALQRRVSDTTRERMLRELAEAVEALTAERPLVLVLEDLHWSDGATLDWLASVARRRDWARLLVLGTYRPTDAIVRAHSVHTVTQELQRQGHGIALVLGYVSAAGVATYLARRLGAQVLVDGLAHILYQRTQGNPLFLVMMVDDLIRQGVLQEGETGWALVGEVSVLAGELPESLRQLIEQQVEQLPLEEQGLLAVASVAGVECTAAAMAAGVEQAVEDVEARCAALARRGQFLQAHGPTDWPDGTVTAQYGFRHALYQEVVYARVPVSRRVRWHRQIGARLEAGYGSQAREIAANLAEHFVRGRDPERAVQYLQVAGAQAVARSAHREAVMRYEQALQMLQHVPQTPETITQVIDVHLALRTALIPLGDTPAIFTHMQTAEALARQLGDRARQGQIAAYWTRDYGVTGHHEKAVVYGQRALTLIHGDRALRMTTQLYLSYAYRSLGGYQEAVTLLNDALGSLATLPAQARLGAALPAAALRYSMVLCLTELGQFDDGIRYGQEALHMAEAAGHLFSLHQVCRSLASLYMCQGAFGLAFPLLERARTLCQEADLPYGLPNIVSALGYAYAQVGRSAAALACLDEARQLAVADRTNSGYAMWLILLGDGYVSVDRVATAVALAQEALATAQERRERGVQGHALRLLGHLAAGKAAPDVARATEYYQHAIALAQELGMRPLLAHSYCGLGLLYQRSDQRLQATAALSTAVDLYRTMAMTFWLPQAEQALARVGQGQVD